MSEENIINEEKIMADLDKKISELESFCLKNKLPFFVSVATEPLLNTNGYVTRAITPTDIKVTLTEDRITKLSLSNNKHLKLVLENEQSETDIGDLYGDLLKEM